VVQPAAAPRFSRTPAGRPGPPTEAGRHTNEVLMDWGFRAADVEALHQAGVVRQATQVGSAQQTREPA
jgi:alpha-methylacyl-CoA racemase